MIKKIICYFKGHILEQESIIKTIGQNNWCRKCLRCGRYFLHSDVGGVTIDAESAMAFKEKFEKEMAWIDDLLKKGGAEHE